MSLDFSNSGTSPRVEELSKTLSSSSFDSSGLSSSSSFSLNDDSVTETSDKIQKQESKTSSQTSLQQPVAVETKGDETRVRKLRSRARTVNHIWVNEFDLEFCSDGEISDASVVWSDYGDEVVLDDDELTQYMNPFQFQLSQKISLIDKSGFPGRISTGGRGKGKRNERNKK